MPGAVPNTSTYALTNATMPYAVALADKGWEQACRDDHSLALGPQHPRRPAHQRAGRRGGRASRRSARTRCWRRRRDRTGRRRPEIARAVRTYLDHLAVERGLAANTLSSYRRDLRRYLEYLDRRGRRPTSTTSPRRPCPAFLVRAARGRRRPPAAELDVGGPDRGGGARLPQVRASPTGWPRSTRPAAVKPPTPAKRLPKALPLADVEAILEAAGAPGTTLALRDRALLEVLYGTGARISEAVGLDVDDLDTVDGTVLLRGKGGKERIVPVGSLRARRRSTPTWSAAAPSWSPAARARPALFLNARGGRLSRQSRLVGAGARPPSGPASPGTSRRTPCGTPSPPTCSTAAPTSASCRSCSATPR